jgi:hypothetical protein
VSVNAVRYRIAALLLSFTTALAAEGYRDSEVAREFQRRNPCPATGLRAGPCPGYIRDHVVPLACGGPDAVSNMQWQTIAGAAAKDRVELN